MNKKITFTSLVILSILCLTSFLYINENNLINLDKIGKLNLIANEEDSSFNHLKMKIDSISIKNYRLDIRTIYSDIKVFDDIGVALDETILKQELIFYSGNCVLNNLEWPSSTIKRVTKKGDTLSVMENVVYELGLLQGNGENFFYTLKGGGFCNACPEEFIFYSYNGTKLWLNISNRYKNIKSEGSFENVFIEFQADSIKWFEGDFQKVLISTDL